VSRTQLLALENGCRSSNDLATFVEALQQDLRDNPDDWENPGLERYLEALAAWIRDMPGYFGNQGIAQPKEPTWSLVASMLHSAKIYE
jgi:hypothetical protein